MHRMNATQAQKKTTLPADLGSVSSAEKPELKKVELKKVTPAKVETTPALPSDSPFGVKLAKSPVKTQASPSQGTSTPFGALLAQKSQAPKGVQKPEVQGGLRMTTAEFHDALRNPASPLAKQIHKLTHEHSVMKSVQAQGKNFLELTLTDVPNREGGTSAMSVAFAPAGGNIDIKAKLPNLNGGEAMCIHLSSQEKGKHVHLEWVGAHPGEKIAVGGPELFKAIDSLYAAVKPEVVSLADSAGFPMVRGDAPNEFPVKARVVGPYTEGASLYVKQGYLPTDSATLNAETYKTSNALLQGYTVDQALADLGTKTVAKDGNTPKTLNQLLAGFAEKGLTPAKDETVGAFYKRLVAKTPAELAKGDVHDFYQIAMERKVTGDPNAKMKGALDEVTTRTMLEKPYVG